MASLYSTNAAASSDPHGSIRSEDALLDLKLARPYVPCGRDDATKEPCKARVRGFRVRAQDLETANTYDETTPSMRT